MKNIKIITVLTVLTFLLLTGCPNATVEFVQGGVEVGSFNADLVKLATDDSIITFSLPADGDTITWYARYASVSDTLTIKLYNEGGKLYGVAGKDGQDNTPIEFSAGSPSDLFKIDSMEFHLERGEGKSGIHLKVSIKDGAAVLDKSGHGNAFAVFEGLKTGYLFGYLKSGSSQLNGEVKFEKEHHHHRSN